MKTINKKKTELRAELFQGLRL